MKILIKSVFSANLYLILKGQEFRVQNKTTYTGMILSSLAYITPITLPFCTSTGKRERENFRKKKKEKKNLESVRNNFTVK